MNNAGEQTTSALDTRLNLLDARLQATRLYTPSQRAEMLRREIELFHAEERLMARLQAGERVVA